MKKSALLGAFVFSTLFACQNADEAATTTPEESTQVMNHSANGYQLYTVREALTGADSISATLRATREMGYEKVESFGYVEGGFLGLSATDFKKAITDAELKSPSGHYMPPELASETMGTIDPASIDAFLDAAEALEQKWVIIPWMNEAWRNKEGYDHLIEYLIQLGEAAAKRGMVAGWHNHDFEFKACEDGSFPIEHIANGADYIDLELDLAWIYVGGQDPIAWLDKFGDRVIAVHVKDRAAAGENADEDGWADVGHGVMDWTAIAAKLRSMGVARFVLEHDNPSDQIRFATRSIATAKTF